MKVAVVGGTGMVGSEVVKRLAGDGHEVRILSRRPPDSLAAGTSHHRIDLHSREGIDDAITGVDAVVDAANERRSPRKILVDGTRDLLLRCENLSVGHYVGISIIGCEHLGFSYYAAKTEQEEVIKSSPIGWSLLKASQFHELIEKLFAGSARIGISPTGPIRLQTIAASAVAERLAGMTVAAPGSTVEAIAGPRVEDLGTMSRAWRQHSGRKCLPLRVRVPGKSGRNLRAGALTDPSAVTAGPNFSDWLASRS